MRIGEVDVFVKDQGKGTPVLFLHGNPDTADIWDGVVGHMQQEYRCIAPDLPGFGRSVAPPDFHCSFENLGRFIDELVETLHLPLPLNLVTHDFGGAFGIAWAAQHEEKVRRIVVINHPFFVADYHWHLWARLWRTPLLGEVSLRTLNWPTFYRIVRYGSRHLSRETIRQTYSFLTPQWKQMVLRLYRAANPADFREWEPRMRKLTAQVPTLVLWGTHDPWVPLWVADRFGAERVVHFPDSGHWTPTESPDQVATEIHDFLRMVRSEPAALS
jgi:pimeloyl-ACP methyl ester carboxylesterase